jgi:hypothetical protein
MNNVCMLLMKGNKGICIYLVTNKCTFKVHDLMIWFYKMYAMWNDHHNQAN